MNEVFVRRDLIDVATLPSFCAASDFRGAVRTLSHVGAIGATPFLLWLFHRLHRVQAIIFSERGMAPPTMTYLGLQARCCVRLHRAERRQISQTAVLDRRLGAKRAGDNRLGFFE